MQRLKSLDQAQDFPSAHAFIHSNFHPRRHLMAAAAYRTIRSRPSMFGGRRPVSVCGVILPGITHSATALAARD
jgi:hypothetical protein